MKLFIVAIIAIMAASCTKLKEVEFKNIVNWKLDDVGISGGKASAYLAFYNPNKFGLVYKHLEGNVFVDGKFLGKCTSDTTINIGANQNFSIPVSINFSTADVLMGGLNFMGKDSILVKFDGSIRAGKAGIFINYRFNTENKMSTSF
jgi:LEA14-like dessication related protein